MYLMVSYFVLTFFPRDVLDWLWDGIESVPENFSVYFFYKSHCDFEIEVKVTKTLSAFCTLPTVNLY